MLGFSYDRKLTEIGTAAGLWLGVGAAYTRFGALAVRGDGSADRSDEETYLAVLPLHTWVALRLTELLDLEIPVVPYTKLGAGYGLWWTRTADGQPAGETRTARGSSSGPFVGLGGLLLLDVLDRAQAAELRATAGVEHSYLAFEWYTSGLGFFHDDAMRIGGTSWTVALALEL